MMLLWWLRLPARSTLLVLCLLLPGALAPAQQAAGQGAEKPGPHTLTPEAREQLLRSLDDIVQFASQDTSLPIRHPVKRRLASRDEVEAYIRQRMAEDEDTQRLKRSELVLKKFGLLPRDFDMGAFLLSLLREQVAGYYDPRTETVNLLDWVDAEQQRPVMAHELTHALQDQSFGLEKWMKSSDPDLAAAKGEPSPADIESDEVQVARQAVVEGQATAVLLDFVLAPMGQSLLDAPDTVAAMRQEMLAGTADSTEFQKAPVFLKEALTFPYAYGLDFVAAVLAERGKKSFAASFADPPRDTRQIMEPKTYLSGERLAPMPVPDLASIFKEYERFDIGAMGEFDVSVLVEQYAGKARSESLYPDWRGGYYYALRPKGRPDAPLALMYASRWASAASAEQFAGAYAAGISQRYQRARESQPASEAPQAGSSYARLAGRHEWITEEGPVVIEVRGDTVLVCEGLESAVTDKLARAILPEKERPAGSHP